MKLWKLGCNVDEYENLICKQEIGVDVFQSFDGREKKKEWKPMDVVRIYERNYGNSIGFAAHIPVFDKKAITVLNDLLIGNVEILPLNCIDGEFYIVNITKVLECIDYSKSIYKTYRDGKRIMRFKKYAFYKSLVDGENLFKIKDERRRSPFVSDEFKQRVEENGLIGFEFEFIWDSDAED